MKKDLHLLTGSLDATDARYERFYGSVVIEPNQESFKLKSTGTSQAFIWLASELTKDPKADSDMTLADSLESEEISLDNDDSFFPPLQWMITLGAIFAVIIALWFILISPSLRQNDPAPSIEQEQQE